MIPTELEEELQFIELFADTIANTFRQFSAICRTHALKASQNKAGVAEIQKQLIEERKRRMDLEDKIREKLSGAPNTELNLPAPEERKRPRNAYTLFVADQREKMLKEHPDLELHKITAIAAIKWKKMGEQQKKTYERKFNEMCRQWQTIQKSANQTTLVKRQDDPENPEPTLHQPAEHDDTENNPQQSFPLQEPQQPQEPQEPQQSQEPRPIQMMLDLFHTLQEPRPSETMADSSMAAQDIQQPKVTEMMVDQSQNIQAQNEQNGDKQVISEAQHELSQGNGQITPSLQIIQQIVIEPTVQEQGK